MKKIIIAGLTGLTFLFGFIPTAFANIYISGYTPPAPPKGIYSAKITNVIISQAHDDSGTLLPGKYFVSVKTNKSMKNGLIIGFDGDDTQSGLAFMNAIGKVIDIKIDRDINDKLTVQSIAFHAQ